MIKTKKVKMERKIIIKGNKNEKKKLVRQIKQTSRKEIVMKPSAKNQFTDGLNLINASSRL